MPYLRGNLHTHTTLSDGMLSPEEVLEAYRARGYDFLAFTDHRCMIGEGPDAEREYFASVPKGDDSLIVLSGIEEEPVAVKKRHVGVIRGVVEQLRILNHPSEYGLSIDDVIESIEASGAHAMELTCHGRHLHRYDVPQIAVPKVATDDAHYVQEIGVSWIEVEVAHRDADSILRAIKNGAFVNFIGGRKR